MKKVAFVTKKMVVGGIEKALLNMINSMSNKDIEITLYIVERGGELEKDIPNSVIIKYLNISKNLFKEALIRNIKIGKVDKVGKIIKNRILLFKNKTIYDSYMYASNILPIEENEYDLAIAYHTAISMPVIYAMNNIKAKKKVTWIHSDLDRYSEYIMKYENIYEQYDKVFCVSKNSKFQLDNLFPKCKDKTEVYYNCIRGSEVRLRAKEFKAFNDGFKGTRIATVGRLSEEKGQLIIPSVVSELIKNGYDIRWYLVGEGDLRKSLQEKIDKYGIGEKLILVGNKDNPYPYINECNIYLQTSKTEGYCSTIIEAKCCYKAIITTEVSGAKEQIDNNINGVIVKRNRVEIIKSIMKLIDEKDIGIRFENELKNNDIDTIKEINKLYKLLDN